MKLFCLALVMALASPVFSQMLPPQIDLPQWLLRASVEAKASPSPATAQLRLPYEYGNLDVLTDEQRHDYLKWLGNFMQGPQRLGGEYWIFPNVFLQWNVYRPPGIYLINAETGALDGELLGEPAKESLGASAPLRVAEPLRLPPKRGNP